MSREPMGDGHASSPRGKGSGEGTFVVIEGAEAVGKSTQVSLLEQWLREREVPHRVGREPGATPLGEAIRTLVLQREDLAPAPESELFLILAARASFVQEEVEPALAAGRVYVADRFDLSTLAYQGYGHGLDRDRIRTMNELATGGRRPDVYVVLDLPDGEGEARQAEAGVPPDRMERQAADFLARVREGYRELGQAEPTAEVVDGRGEPEEVHRRVLQVLSRRLGAPFALQEGEPFVGEGG